MWCFHGEGVAGSWELPDEIAIVCTVPAYESQELLIDCSTRGGVLFVGSGTEK